MRFQDRKKRIISYISNSQHQYDVLNHQFYFYSKEVRTEIIHKGKNLIDMIPLNKINSLLQNLLLLIYDFCVHELFYNCQNVGHLDDDVIFAVELQLLARVLASHNLVAGLDRNLYVVGARAGRDDFRDHGFFFIGGGEDDAGRGLFLSFHVLEQNIVCQRGQLHNNYLQYPVAVSYSAFYKIF